VVATVSVSRKGEVRVERFDVAMDTGQFLVNPLAAERQIEMQMVMGLAAVLRQEITVEKGRVVQSNFHDYPLLRATEMPEIRIHFVRATDEPIVGIGEEALGWAAALTQSRVRRAARRIQRIVASDAPAGAAIAGTTTEARLPGTRRAVLISKRCAPSRAALKAESARRTGT